MEILREVSKGFVEGNHRKFQRRSTRSCGKKSFQHFELFKVFFLLKEFMKKFPDKFLKKLSKEFLT